MKALHILAALFAVSVLVNVGFVAVIYPSLQSDISRLVDKTNRLGAENMQLQKQLDQQNITLQNYVSQLSFYRANPQGLPGNNNPSGSVTGFASLQAPAVSQHIVQDTVNGFVTQRLVQNGSMMNISVEIRPGQDRILVQTTPLMGIVFQDAANTAVYVAQKRTGVSLAGSDVIFSIEAEHQISSVDGPSAGALMTLLMISALGNQPINPAITVTGTIDKDGHVGAVGGIIEKATAAKESGKTTFLLPKENNMFVQYSRKTSSFGGFTVVEQVPERISAPDYIKKNIGIDVVVVDTIDEVLKAGLKLS
jgi:predicted S18 family serine protease